MKNLSGPALFDIDENAVRGYLRRLAEIAKSGDDLCRIDLAGILSLPGVVQPVEPREGWVQQMRQTVLELLDEALNGMRRMRQEEGRSLADDMLGQCDSCGVISTSSVSARIP